MAKPSALAGHECARVSQANAKPPTKAGANGQAEAFSAGEGQGDEQEEADEAKKPVVTPLRGNRNTGGQQFLE